MSMDASTWFSNESEKDIIDRLGLTADTTDERISELAEQEAREAKTLGGNAGIIILTGVAKHLTELRDQLRDREPANQ